MHRCLDNIPRNPRSEFDTERELTASEIQQYMITNLFENSKDYIDASAELRRDSHRAPVPAGQSAKGAEASSDRCRPSLIMKQNIFDFVLHKQSMQTQLHQCVDPPREAAGRNTAGSELEGSSWV